MKSGSPTNIRSLDARLRNHCTKHGFPEGRMRRLLGILALGQFLSVREGGVIKGASNLELRLGTLKTRVSSDLDAVRQGSINDFRANLEASLRGGWAGFTGVLRDRGEIAVPAADGYRPHRFDAKLSYGGRPFGSITLEVAVDEAGGLQAIEHVTSADAAQLCATLGLPPPEPVPVLALEQQIAQKLHACTTPDEGEWFNDRAHDLVDLQLARQLVDGPLIPIRDACQRLFASRRRHAWPPTVTPRAGWPERYAEEARGLPVHQHVDEAVSWTNDLIRQIDHAGS